MNYDESPLRELTGNCLRPGGPELTLRGLALCAFAPKALVLDLGCGAGASLALLRGAGIAPLGLDASERLLSEARACAPVLRADMAALPLAAASLDGIVCECALSLAGDKAAVLRECCRALKPGGRLLLCDLVRREEGAGPPAAGGVPPCVPCAAGAQSASALAGLLAGAGFSVLAVEDHTQALRELAARIVWRFGSLAAFAALMPGNDETGGGNAACDGGKGLGYCLMVAEKSVNKERDPHEITGR